MKKKNNLFIGIIIIFILIVGFLLINNIINSSKTGELLKISYSEIKTKIKNKEDIILIVSRTSCSHCMSYKPKMEQIAKDYNLKIYYIDYDEEKEEEKFLEYFKLDGTTPITIFIKKGKETSILKRLEGDLEKEKELERLKEMKFINK